MLIIVVTWHKTVPLLLKETVKSHPQIYVYQRSTYVSNRTVTYFNLMYVLFKILFLTVRQYELSGCKSGNALSGSHQCQTKLIEQDVYSEYFTGLATPSCLECCTAARVLVITDGRKQ